MGFFINDNGIIDINGGGYSFKIDYNNSSFIKDKYVSSDKFESIKKMTIIEGGTMPRYSFDVKEGYEKNENYVRSLDLGTKRSVIYSIGYLLGDYVYGICNVYKQTCGYLSGGGRICEEDIAYSVYYRYDNSTDEFMNLYKAIDALIIAFSNDKAIYWKNKNYMHMT